MYKRNLIVSYSLSFLIFFLYALSFFRSYLISILLSAILSLKFKELFLEFFDKKQLIKKRDMFRNFLDVLNASVASGSNFYQSIKDSTIEMSSFYSAKEFIVIELNNLLSNIDNGYTLENALELFRLKMDFEEASIFIDSLKIGLKSGMDIKEVIRNSKFAINEQIIVENEISLSLNNSKREFIIMIVLPIVILLLLNKTDARVLNFVDYIIRSVVFFMVILSIYMGEKIVKLEI